MPPLSKFRSKPLIWWLQTPLYAARHIKAWLRKRFPSRFTQSRKREFSYGDEEKIIARHFDKFGARTRFFVDIAPSDGKDMSNTWRLALQGWRGLAVEADAPTFAALAKNYAALPCVTLLRALATPQNVCSILHAAHVPHEFDFLSLDIDSADFWVLVSLLETHRPRLFCVEINETIPPPLRFTVCLCAEISLEKRFFGMSLSEVASLARNFGYGLLCVEYNNAFFAPVAETGVDLEDVAAFQAGFVDRAGRKEKFAWNASWEPIFDLSTEEAKAFIEKKFAAFEGHYRLNLPAP